ncbi:HAMP domain-containing sensor histidine kinase [Hyphomicrobium sp.]|uniref:sensor histidine kinase n=1 Tax=Hyphomicrobium sp. TaxID=82 RepID=UPI002C245238|nr:HAMP domain-containing sensor histidine kinase [Hyphomicrobium sp.]HRN87526.1 HAMP domain-containing sensor histidine kinase [Hyphomicrobium sp.]HRQ27035.1 HAMP domain-containing sensor histidine kinase [Hyphomicrobium sp.]
MLDAKTIFVVSILSDTIFCLCGLLLWRLQPQISGMLPLAMTFAARGVGLSVLVAGHAFSPFFGIWFGNLFIAVSVVLMLEGFARFLGQPAPRRLQIALVAAVGITWPFLLWLRPEDVTLRMSIIAFLGAVSYAYCALMFVRDDTLPIALHRVTVTWWCVVSAMCFASGVIVWFVSPRSLFEANPFVEVYLLLHLLSFLVKGVMTAILVGVRLRGELLTRIEDERAQLLMLSHELRTPLAIVSRSSELLDQTKAAADPSDVRRVAQIRSAASRMSALVEQFLVRARHGSGHERTDRFDLAEEIRSLALSPRIVLDLPKQLTFTGDRKMMGIIFSNIVDNALKYSPADSLVDVSLRSGDGRIYLTVKDRGVGLGPDEDRLRLGEKFFRAPNARGTAGMGLGLYTVRKLVARHGGTITLAPREGGGAIATITCPGAAHAA